MIQLKAMSGGYSKQSLCEYSRYISNKFLTLFTPEKPPVLNFI